MTSSPVLPPEVLEQLRALDPAAHHPRTAPEALSAISSRIVAAELLVRTAPQPRGRARRRPLLLAAVAAVVVAVVAGVVLSGWLSRSAGPIIAAPPSTGTSSAPAFPPLARGETAAAIYFATVDGEHLTLTWSNGRCVPNPALDKQLVRTEYQPTPQGLEVLVVVKENPAGQPTNGACRGIGDDSTTTITLTTPLEPAVVLDLSTTPASAVAVETRAGGPWVGPTPVPDAILAELRSQGTEVTPVVTDRSPSKAAQRNAGVEPEFVSLARVTVTGFTKAGKRLVSDRLVWVFVSPLGRQVSSGPAPEPGEPSRKPLTQLARTAALVDAATDEFLYGESV